MTKFKLNVYGKQASGYHLLTNDRLYVIVTPTRFPVRNNATKILLPMLLSTLVNSSSDPFSCFICSYVSLLFYHAPVKAVGSIQHTLKTSCPVDPLEGLRAIALSH